MSANEKERHAAKLRAKITSAKSVMLAVPEVRRAAESKSALQLICPKGHRLFKVFLEILEDYPGGPEDIEIRALPGKGKQGRAPAAQRDSFAMKLARSICDEPGCPEMIAQPGYCASHGDAATITIDHLQTRFTCHSSGCGWTERVNADLLLKAITVQLTLGSTKIAPNNRRVAVSSKRRKR